MTTLIGQMAPDFALPASNGQTVNLLIFMGKILCSTFIQKI